MKRIGIIGGLSAESTTHFYGALTKLYVEQHNDTDYPEIVLFSVRFQTFMNWSKAGEWDKFTNGLLNGLQALRASGADFAVIAANLPHVVFDEVEHESPLPLLHIADAVSASAHQRGFRRVALIGTLPTMNASFYHDRLKPFGIECMTPSVEHQMMIQEILDTELFRGIMTTEAEQKFIHIIDSMKEQGSDAVILGCTEIPMLISDTNSPLPVLDSTMLFVKKTLETALFG
ncbi:aspartate/glutamate racemase family protein [Sulfoacidibacillus ferrooxidans]|uniref:Racemase YgeA n=1 Tax=Sulfoacidibacillus ferrooxidans TaxID=2005001 RepID=A0A9X1VE74_9BACL|nr:amino acid racemase [Sulfoacidibacillus ferrooxidans]MCI0184528.1 putative racemase YgeA [Sulfoacidibacillus ferrooxidans]